ncbi:hypothetical protein GWI33_022866 [Rhynchophorus ferrugineus]|uniref:Uncharacterized protein n=1 Tax=Rhynchophorus ferrugineus TaxID=354439 RepID=A0A834J035_RHYFE|nr:hypothetical protein GWI33_022866 [Rhynchophorus ferrugineus]
MSKIASVSEVSSLGGNVKRSPSIRPTTGRCGSYVGNIAGAFRPKPTSRAADAARYQSHVAVWLWRQLWLLKNRRLALAFMVN